MKTLKTIIGTVIVIVLIGFAYLFSGLYDPAADVPHWRATSWLIGAGREASIERRVNGLSVPDLADPALVRTGAEHYSKMCAGCHLAPDKNRSGIRQALYPHPPDLTRIGDKASPKELFWVTKHGLKMTGMPAWGLSHSDDDLWAIVAFVRKMPGMSVDRYRMLAGIEQPVAPAAPDHSDSEHGGANHGHADGPVAD